MTSRLYKFLRMFAAGMILIHGILPRALAAEFTIVSIIQDVPMKPGEKPVKDYYINAGSHNGLISGAYIEVRRKMPVLDNLNAKTLGETAIPVARLKIIHVDRAISIGRLVKIFDRKENPVSGFDDVMVGDVIKVAKEQKD